MPKKKLAVADEQLELIEVAPKNAKVIKRAAKAYKEAQTERISWLAEEKKHKEKILTLIENENLMPLEGGVIRIAVNGAVITVTPRDNLVKVKFEDGDDGEE